jgi:hypothetical protein
MRQYRFVASISETVFAKNLEKAIEIFKNRMHEKQITEDFTLRRIETLDENGEYVPVDRPLRAGDVDKKKVA